MIVFSFFVFFSPNTLGHPDNYIEANPLVTPASIVPEWYLLPFYAILRSIPDKLLGVIAMFGAILVLLTLPVTDRSIIRGNTFRPLSKFSFFVFACVFVALGYLGQKHVEIPYVALGQYLTAFYFLYFVLVVPVVSTLENIAYYILAINTNK